MKHLAQALTIIVCFALALAALFAYLHNQQTPDAVKALEEAQRLEWMRQRHQAGIVALWALTFGAVGLIASGVGILIVQVRNARQRIYAEDGLFPVIIEATGRNQRTAYNPNLLAAAAGTIHVGNDGATTISMARNGFDDRQLIEMHSRQQRVQLAQTRQRQAGPNRWEVMERNGLLPQPKRAEPAQLPAPASSPAMLPLLDAITQSSADKFVLGQSSAGQLCTINPRAAVHFAILGATGCGKTASTGYHLALAAMTAKYQLVILDGKGGMDWSVFADAAEVHDTDRSTFVEQLRIVSEEYHRRLHMAKRYQVAHVAQLRADDMPPLLVVVEEFGDLMRSLSRAQAGQVDNMLDSIGAKGRAADVHFCLIDQGTGGWSDTVIGATKAKVLYKLPGSDAARVADWHAQTLPDVGAFRYNGSEYNAWHVQPHVQRLLTSGQRAGVFGSYPRLIDADYTVVHDDGQPDGQPDSHEDPPAADGRTDNESRSRVWAYLDQYPDATVRHMATVLGMGKSQVGIYRQSYFERGSTP